MTSAVNARRDDSVVATLARLVEDSPQADRFRALQDRAHRAVVDQHVMQAKMTFGDGTQDLDIHGKGDVTFDPAYRRVQERAKEIEPKIIVSLDDQGRGRQAAFRKYGKGGLIKVRQLPGPDNADHRYDRSARLIAMTHETQHALDHLDPDSPMVGQLDEMTGQRGVRTELHAFAAQAAETQQLVLRGEKVERKLRDMAAEYLNSKAEEPHPQLLAKMRYYAWYYSNADKEAHPDFTEVENSDVLLDDTRLYIATYFEESKRIYRSLMAEDSAAR